MPERTVPGTWHHRHLNESLSFYITNLVLRKCHRRQRTFYFLKDHCLLVSSKKKQGVLRMTAMWSSSLKHNGCAEDLTFLVCHSPNLKAWTSVMCHNVRLWYILTWTPTRQLYPVRPSGNYGKVGNLYHIWSILLKVSPILYSQVI